jgi:hypothetical protein
MNDLIQAERKIYPPAYYAEKLNVPHGRAAEYIRVHAALFRRQKIRKAEAPEQKRSATPTLSGDKPGVPGGESSTPQTVAESPQIARVHAEQQAPPSVWADAVRNPADTATPEAERNAQLTDDSTSNKCRAATCRCAFLMEAPARTPETCRATLPMPGSPD